MVKLSTIINAEIDHSCHRVERFSLFMLKLSLVLAEQAVSPDDVTKIIRHYSILFRKLFVDMYDPETPPYFLQQ